MHVRVVRDRTHQGHTAGVLAIAWSHDGKRLLSGGYDRTARVWNVASGKELQRLEGHGELVSCAVFLPDDRHAITASYDKTLRLWKVRK